MKSVHSCGARGWRPPRFMRALAPLLSCNLALVACGGPLPDDTMGETPSDTPATDDPIAPAPDAGRRDESVELSTQAVTESDKERTYYTIKELGGLAFKWGGTFASMWSSGATTLQFATMAAEILGIMPKTKSDVEKLRDDLNDFATGLDWKIHTDNHLDRLIALEAALNVARSLAERGIRLEETSHPDFESHMATSKAGEPDTFYHRHQLSALQQGFPSKTNISGYFWRKHNFDVERIGDQSYDWRFGIPAFLQLIGMRINIIAAIDPGFRTSGAFDGELNTLRGKLLQNYDKMVDGVRCAWDDETGTGNVFCADVHSGIHYWGKTCQMKPYWGTGCTFEQAQREAGPVMATLRQQILAKMPLFAMRKMADLLGLYAQRGKDLTELDSKINFVAAPDLCIDVQWGVSNAGTPVWLWPCDGGVAQQWKYDRASGLIRNPAFDKCLDVQWGSRNNFVPVWTWHCNSSEAQQWTYDPKTGLLQNALGTVLEAANFDWSTMVMRLYRDWGLPVPTLASLMKQALLHTNTSLKSAAQKWQTSSRGAGLVPCDGLKCSGQTSPF